VGALLYANVTNGHSEHQTQQGVRSQLQQLPNQNQNQFPPQGSNNRRPNQQHKRKGIATNHPDDSHRPTTTPRYPPTAAIVLPAATSTKSAAIPKRSAMEMTKTNVSTIQRKTG